MIAMGARGGQRNMCDPFPPSAMPGQRTKRCGKVCSRSQNGPAFFCRKFRFWNVHTRRTPRFSLVTPPFTWSERVRWKTFALFGLQAGLPLSQRRMSLRNQPKCPREKKQQLTLKALPLLPPPQTPPSPLARLAYQGCLSGEATANESSSKIRLNRPVLAARFCEALRP